MLTLYFDGGCKPNPGEREVAVAIQVADGYEYYHERVGYGTNNQAEWLGLLVAMEIATMRGARDVTIYGDSSLVVNQANGAWKCKDANLQEFLEEYKRLRKDFVTVKLVYVPRAKNIAGIHIEEVNP